MHIVFLCGSLEPGRDGVGDYVRRLAGALLQQGHQAAAVALHDPFVDEETVSAQPADGEALPVWRLPASWSARRRFGRARQRVAALNPDWVSLQFVPYAFQTKGLPLLLGWQLRPLVRGRQVHVMMHETWLGAEAHVPLRRRLLVRLQRGTVRRLLHQLQPAVLHTHLPAYQAQIAALRWLARPLPLFSNIPVVPAPATREVQARFRVGIFSQADKREVLAGFLRRLDVALAGSGLPLQVLLIGGTAAAMGALQAVLETEAGLRGRVHYTGFLEPGPLSEALQSCDLGLTPVPRHAVGKSGSTAAFLAHGRPVAAPAVHWGVAAEDVGFFSASLRATIVLEPDLQAVAVAREAAQQTPELLQVSTIARLFSDDLASIHVPSLSI